MIIQNFIAFEGLDGSGTSTQIELLKPLCKDKGFLFTAEPTKAPTGVFLRKMLKGDFPVSNETAAYLFAADRNEHVNGSLIIEENRLITGIKEACKQGKTVISDRYLFSSLAYQSIQCAREVPLALNAFFPLPELLFFFEIEPKKALERIATRESREIYENEAFLAQVATSYEEVLALYKESQMRIIRINATQSKEDIHSLILREL